MSKFMNPDNAHADLGPSSLPRIEICPGSVRAIRQARDEGLIRREQESGKAADAGHIAHAAMDTAVYQNDIECINEFRLDDDSKQLVKDTFAQVQKILDEYDDELVEYHVEREERVDPWDFFDAINEPVPAKEDTSGTMDLSIHVPENQHVDIADYKFGYIYVPIKSPQFLAYALGKVGQLMLKGYTINTVRILAFQPQRHEEPEELFLTFEELDKLAFSRFTGIINGAIDPNAPLNHTEEGCMFCPLKGHCQAQLDTALAAFAAIPIGDGDDSPSNVPTTISDEELNRWVNSIPLIKAWCNQLQAAAQERIELGRDIPDWKLIPSSGNRAWADEEAAEKFMAARKIPKAERYVSKLIGPAPTEKKLKALGSAMTKRAWTEFEKLITRKEGGYKLVPSTHKTEGVKFESAIERFEKTVIEDIEEFEDEGDFFDDDLMD